MSNEEHHRKLERMYHAAPTNGYYKPKLTIGDGEADIRIPIRKEFFHAANGVHGSVYFKAMDDVAFFAVSSLVEDEFVLTVSFSVYFTRPISKGEILGEGRVVHASRRLYVAESILHDQRGRQIARGSGTFMRSGMRLGPELGYQ